MSEQKNETAKERIWLYDGVVYHRRPGPDDQDIECTAYTRSDIADRHKRQRGRLREAAEYLRSWMRDSTPLSHTGPGNLTWCLDELSAAIAECEEDGS